jgi:hypothetical protein
LIRGRFQRRGPFSDIARVPYVGAAVSVDGALGRHEIRFLIDTGADRTTIGIRDAIRIWPAYRDHDFDADPTIRTLGGPGGTLRGVLRRVTAHFTDEDESTVQVDIDALFIEPKPDDLFLVPTLLGRDVLQRTRFIMDDAADFVGLDLHGGATAPGSPAS